MNLTQDQLTQLLGQKELNNYALQIQIQTLQQEIQQKDSEIESLKQQLKSMEKQDTGEQHGL